MENIKQWRESQLTSCQRRFCSQAQHNEVSTTDCVLWYGLCSASLKRGNKGNCQKYQLFSLIFSHVGRGQHEKAFDTGHLKATLLQELHRNQPWFHPCWRHCTLSPSPPAPQPTYAPSYQRESGFPSTTAALFPAQEPEEPPPLQEKFCTSFWPPSSFLPQLLHYRKRSERDCYSSKAKTNS